MPTSILCIIIFIGLLLVAEELFCIPETIYDNLQLDLLLLSDKRIQKAVEKGNYICLDKQIKKVKKNLPAPEDDSFLRDSSSPKLIYIYRLLNSYQYMHFTNLLNPLTENYKKIVDRPVNSFFYKVEIVENLYEEDPKLLKYEKFLYENLCKEVFLNQAYGNMNLSKLDFAHEYDRYLFEYFYFIIHMLAQDKALPDGDITILDFCMKSYVACVKLQKRFSSDTSPVAYPIEWPTKEEAEAFMECYRNKYPDFYKKHLLKYELKIQNGENR